MLSHGALRVSLNARETRITPQAAVFRRPETEPKLDFSYTIDSTWDGEHCGHERYVMELFWVETKEEDRMHVGRSDDPWLSRLQALEVQNIPGRPLYYIDVKFKGPLFDDPEPPRQPAGHHSYPGVNKLERMEFYFCNEQRNITRVVVTPHGQWHVQLFDAPRRPVKVLDHRRAMPLDVNNTLVASEWRCHVRVPLAYFPARVTRINAFAVHNVDGRRHVDALAPVDEGGDEAPDFMNVDKYKKVEFDDNKLVKGGYNSKVHWDHRFGELWPGR